MVLYPNFMRDRMIRAGSEASSIYDIMGRRDFRARSALPESLYEDAYNRSEKSALRRSMSSVRSVSLMRTEYDDDILRNSLVQHALAKVPEVVERSPVRYSDYFRTSDALVHAKITIRKRDNYWRNKYMQDIENAQRSVVVVRPRYIVQRPVYVYNPPPQPIRIPEPPRIIYRHPRTSVVTTTYRKVVNYRLPSRYYTTGIWSSYPSYF